MPQQHFRVPHPHRSSTRVSPGRQLQDSPQTPQPPSTEPFTPAPRSDRAGPKQASSALKREYSPSDNSSSSSASLARTSAGSDAGSRSAIPPLEKHFSLCFPTVSPSFFLSRPPLKSQKSKLGQTVRARRAVCGSSAEKPPQNNHQVSTNMADPLPGTHAQKIRAHTFFFVTMLLLYFMFCFLPFA